LAGAPAFCFLNSRRADHVQEDEARRQVFSEGSSIGDFNHDGKLDISAGPVYYAAPDWRRTPVVRNPKEVDPHGYSESFCNYAEDVNGDGRTDLIVVGFPGKRPGGMNSRPKHRANGSAI